MPGEGHESCRKPPRCAVCALGEERVLQLGTQVNAQQSDTFGLCMLLAADVNIAFNELPSGLGE